MEEKRKAQQSTVPEAKKRKKTMVDIDQPTVVCYPCGVKYGFFRPGTCSWSKDVCGVCGTEQSVTEPRDFGYLAKGWKEKQDAIKPE